MAGTTSANGRPAGVPALTVLVGKGGVGRSTVAAAMGLAASRRGLRTLVVEVAARQSVPALFGVAGAGYRPVECAPRLSCLRVTWEDALREYGLMKLRVGALYRLVFENPLVRRLVPAIPGTSEILVIGKVVFLVTDGIPGWGRPDLVILDAPATGHGIALVTAPSVVESTVRGGPLAEDARALDRVLRDRVRTRFHLVTTPEEMPVAEAADLFAMLSGQHGMPFGETIVNALSEAGLSPEERDILRHVASSRTDDRAIAAAAHAALFMDARSELQRAHLDRLKRSVPLPIVRLPDVPGAPGDRIGTLAEHLDSVLWREGR